MVGRESDTLSEEAARELLEVVPHARYADVAGARHMVAGDRNDVFASAVVAFLDDVLAPGAGEDEATSWGRVVRGCRRRGARQRRRAPLHSGGVLGPRHAGEIEDHAVGDAAVAPDDQPTDLRPGALGEEVGEDVVVGHRRHARDVARLLLLPDPRGHTLVAQLVEDEGVVRRRAVEGDLHPGHLPPAMALLVGVTEGGERRDDVLGPAAGGGGVRQHRAVVDHGSSPS